MIEKNQQPTVAQGMNPRLFDRRIYQGVNYSPIFMDNNNYSMWQNIDCILGNCLGDNDFEFEGQIRVTEIHDDGQVVCRVCTSDMNHYFKRIVE
jgi:hypothetical protein